MNFDDVVAFRARHGLPVPTQPQTPTDAQWRTRERHLKEELDEFVVACMEGDRVGAFDALLDIVYVAMGAAAEYGFPWQAGWEEVQRANMERVRVASAYESKRGDPNDLKKPEGWITPDIAGVLGRAEP